MSEVTPLKESAGDEGVVDIDGSPETCSADSWDVCSSHKQVVNWIHKAFDIYSSHVVVVSISSSPTALYCHKMVVPGMTSK